ncbi:hypothetical protein A6A27_19975 [Micromonospora sp. CB01531]|nr:hypothetical protein A6A27_19975 [Micromonospora sp. CB01531]
MIDRQLRDAGWVVQDRSETNLFAGTGVAVREVIMAKGHGRVDYLLYVDQRVVGVIEAKPEGTPLSGVEWQSAMYAEGLPPAVRLKALTRDGRLPFVFEASGSESHFTNGYDPQPRARRIFAFPQPGTLARIVRGAEADPKWPTWRAKVRHLPPLDIAALRPAQITAVEGIERSLAEQRFDRSLVQMATGAGKTYTAVTECYRLLKHGGFTRVLFLVDRNNLADQTLAEFQNYRTPGDGRRFTELYNVDKLSSAGMLGSSSVVISRCFSTSPPMSCGRSVRACCCNGRSAGSDRSNNLTTNAVRAAKGVVEDVRRADSAIRRAAGRRPGYPVDDRAGPAARRTSGRVGAGVQGAYWVRSLLVSQPAWRAPAW